MRVLIVSKTKIGEVLCIGGLTHTDKQSVRLLDANGGQPTLADGYAIGQIWDMDFAPAARCDPPHTEDVLVIHKIYERQLTPDELRQVLLRYRHLIRVVDGNIGRLYEGHLFLGKRAYISGFGIPAYSTLFWCADVPLLLDISPHGRVYYAYRSGEYDLKIPFVGFDNPISTIPTNTLVRMSLARWFDQAGKTEPRCYLQLSGWY